MQTLSIIKAPYDMSWSRNPVLFSFRVAPFTTSDISARTRIQLVLHVETEFNSGIFEPVWIAFEYPDHLGYATIDLSAVLDTQLEFYVPNGQYIKFHRCKKQVKRYFISYGLYNNDVELIAPVNSIRYFVAKGGLSKEQWHRSEFFETNILLAHDPLHNVEDNAPIRTDEPRWLFFMMPANNSTYLKLVVNQALNGTLGPTYDMFEQSMSASQWEIFCIPIDYRNLDILAQTPPGEICTQYTVAVYDDTVQLIATQSLRIDYRPFYEPQYLLYRNSLGGLDTQSFLGDKDFDIDIVKSGAEVVQLPDYLNRFNMQFERFTVKSFRDQKTKSNTGWISKTTVERLIDMFLDKQVYTPLGIKLLPVQINSKSATLYKDSSKLYNLTLEWAIAWADENFTQRDTVAQGDTCPAVFYFEAGQIYGGKLHIIWKLEGDYDKIEVEYIVDGTPYTETFLGNSGEAHIIIQPVTGVDKNVRVRARTVCNDEVAPLSYGPWTNQVNLTVYALIAPLANPDTADETFRGLGIRTLMKAGVPLKIMDNDLAFNGGLFDWFEFTDLLNVATLVTENGATIVYNPANGETTYDPTGTSLAILDEDFVHYRMREFVPGPGYQYSNYAKIRIPLKGQIPKVYVHFNIVNDIAVTKKYGFLNQYEHVEHTCDVYIQYFLDAAMSIPVDVTSFGLIIAYDQTQILTPYGYFGVPSAPVTTTLPLATFAAVGTSQLVIGAWKRKEHVNNGLSGADLIERILNIQPASGTGNWQYV